MLAALKNALLELQHSYRDGKDTSIYARTTQPNHPATR